MYKLLELFAPIRSRKTFKLLVFGRKRTKMKRKGKHV